MVNTSTVALAGGGAVLGAGALYYLTKGGGGNGSKYGKRSNYWLTQLHKELHQPQQYSQSELQADASSARSSAAAANASLKQHGCQVPMSMSQAKQQAAGLSSVAQQSLWWKRYAITENQAANACLGHQNQQLINHAIQLGELALISIPLTQFLKWLRGRTGGGGGGGGGGSGGGGSSSSKSGTDTLTVKALTAASGTVLGSVFVALADASGSLVTETRTDFQGVAKLTGLTDGALYHLTLSTSGYKPVSQQVALSGDTTVTAHLQALSSPSSNTSSSSPSSSNLPRGALSQVASALGISTSQLISDSTALALTVAIAGSLLIPVVGEADAVPLASALASELGLGLSADAIVSAISELPNSVLAAVSDISVAAA